MKNIQQKRVIFLFLALLLLISIAKPCFGVTLLTKREALVFIFPDAQKIETEKRTLSDAQFEKIKNRLGGKMVAHAGQKDTSYITNQRDFDFYFGVKEGKRAGVAMIMEEPGRWGPIMFIIGLNLDGSVMNLAVVSYTETRGRPLSSRSFLKQFIGKASKDDLDKEIDAISGATISSKAAVFTIKKAILLYEELYLEK